MVVIEYNLEAIETADRIVDLDQRAAIHSAKSSPSRTPEEIAANPRSCLQHTANWLAIGTTCSKCYV